MEAPVSVTLTCRRCGTSTPYTFDHAVVDPDPAAVDPAWDGIVFSRVACCAQCGVDDDYDVAPGDRKRIVEEARRRPSADAIETGGVRRARLKLQDGTTVKRPSHAIAHAREVAAAHPESAPDLCRYGNVCSVYGLPDEAERAWHRALDLSEEEVEAAYKLAANLWHAERMEEALGFVQLTLKRYARAMLRKDLLREIVDFVVYALEASTQIGTDAVALLVILDDGAVGDKARVTMSSVALRSVRNWDRLAVILASGRVITASIVSDLPDPSAGPTILERMLAGASTPTAVGRPITHWQPGRSSLSKKRKKRRPG